MDFQKKKFIIRTGVIACQKKFIFSTQKNDGIQVGENAVKWAILMDFHINQSTERKLWPIKKASFSGSFQLVCSTLRTSKF